ncbi:PAS domain-containing sensor histidine kinase [Chryseosolibacter indicus]|uniref:histidine kinase n=1 Tax=Chryseosolibacter indicus TaxID=2782351 RepID=A0ABS5VVE9_9BACT|nr:PAS domain S-box protein [Chryseosolibacter indicus]MBT1705408.1 PAS domain S-box protein [Chryseosolibacter indicus]
MPRKSINKGKPRKQLPGKKSLSKKKSVSSASSSYRKKLKNLSEVEQRLNLALEVAQIGTWEWNIRTNDVTWSAGVHKLFGLSKEAFDGTFETYLNLIHPNDRKAVTERINYALSNNTTCSVIHRLVWLNGEVRWLECIGKTVLGRNKKPLKMTGTIQDITTRKNIEQEREDWKTRHELVAKSAGLVIYDYDISSGNIVWSGNSDFVLGYRSEELGNIQRWIKLIHADDREQALLELKTAQGALTPYDVNYRFRKKNGDYCYMHDRGFFVADQNGDPTRMLGMMMDVSKARQTEETLKENYRFRESIERTMPGILYVHDLSSRQTIYINKVEAPLSFTNGKDLYTDEDLNKLKGEIRSKIIHPDDIKKLYHWTKEVAGTVRESEYRVLMKDNQYRWFHSRDTPFRWDEQGNVTQIIGISQDITAQKEASEKLRNSERSYRELFDSVGEGICIQREDGLIIDVNRGASVLYGYNKEELIGRTPGFLSAEKKNDFDFIRHKLKEAARGEIQRFEFWGKKKNEEVFLVEVQLTKGTYFGEEIIIATHWDITERRKTEEALRESEQRFRALHAASFGGIGLHDHGVIIDCNQGLCNLTGFTYDELIGKNGIELIAPEWRDFVINNIKTSFEGAYDVEGIKKDGTRYILEVHGKNIPYEGKNIRVTEFRDVTERKRAQEQIIEQNTKLIAVAEDLKRKNDQLEEFTQIVSHNLRSPVGNIVTLLSFFENTTSEAERKEYLNLLKESSAMTLYMLNDLNEVLKVKQNKNIEKQELRFEAVLQQVFKMLNAKISNTGAQINFDFNNGPTLIYPNIYLESILLNLLDNALKYRHPERPPYIEFKTYKDRSDNTVLVVRDNGLGINLQRYGHQVFKLRKTFHKHPESRGVGLFMIKNQIETMGGEITIESKEGEGSTFLINFSKHQSDATQ